MADDEVFELINEEIFDDLSQAIPVMYWLVHLLGDKVSFPIDEQFWKDNYPEDARLILRKEDGKMIMYAQKRAWQ